MSISIDVVEKVAGLAKLEFSDAEKNDLTKQLSQVVDYMEKLNEIDTGNIPPTSHVIELKNVFREDKVGESLSQEDALENAPKQKHGYFSVPKVIG